MRYFPQGADILCGHRYPIGEDQTTAQHLISAPLEVDTFDGKLFVEWDPGASVTPLGQLPFFIQSFKLGGRFEPWIDDCPLHYQSPMRLRRSMFWVLCFSLSCQAIDAIHI
jgi:hypothetical protein